MSRCRSCDAEVIFVPSVAGKTMILDAKSRKMVVLSPLPTEPPPGVEVIASVADAYTDHHATCPDSEAWRGKTRGGR